MPLVGLLVAVAPVPGTARQALQSSATGAGLRYGWRLGLLAVGTVGVGVIAVRAQLEQIGRGDLIAFPIVAGALVAGVFATVPALTRLMAAGLARFGTVPSLKLAGRRLQHDPGRSTRLVTATLAALFVLSLIQPIITVYIADPVYQADRRAATTGPQILSVYLPRGALISRAEPILTSHGASRVELGTTLITPACTTRSSGPPQPCPMAFVGTCWGLRTTLVAPDCHDTAPAWINTITGPNGAAAPTRPTPVEGRLVWTGNPGDGSTRRLPVPTATIHAHSRGDVLPSTPPVMFLPANTPGVAAWLADQPVSLVVQAGGGIGTGQTLTAALRTSMPDAYAMTTRAFANYVQTHAIVTGLRSITIGVAALGLLTFLLAGVDHVLARRSSLTGLLALGIPAGTLRRAQLWESLLPLGLGIPAAVALGATTGATVLRIAAAPQAAPPIGVTIGLAAGCVAGVAVIATVLLTVSVPRIDPEALRTP